MKEARNCGACTACCEGWLTSAVLDMGPGKPCSQCGDTGCLAYEARPENPCREFKCGWLADPDLYSEELRPDLCGAIILNNVSWRTWSVLRAIPCGKNLPDETRRALTQAARRQGKLFSFIEHRMEGDRYLEPESFITGPPAFIEVAKTCSPEDLQFDSSASAMGLVDADIILKS